MANQEVGLRLALRGRREVGADLQATAKDLEEVGKAAETSGKKASISSRAWAKTKGVLGGVATGLGRLVKGGLLTATAVGIGLIGTALHKGFNRLTGIENATAKLKGLGHTGKGVDKIMKNALASVRGTAFGMDEAATVAAGAVAAGIKPGKELRKTLKLVADGATIAGSSMGEMGAIWNKVATSNKIQGEVINQLSDRGIPIVKLLAKELGVTAEEVMLMSRKGTIGFDTFRKAMESGMGGAALKSGNTTQGALKNVGAAMGRFGASLMSGAFPMIKKLAKEAIIVVDGLTERLGPLMERMNASLGPKMSGKIKGSGERILAVVDRISASIGRMVADYKKGGFKGVLDGLQMKGVGKNSGKLAAIGTAFGEIGDAIGKVDWDAVKTNLGSGVSDTISVFSVAIGFAADHVDELARYMPQLVTALVAYKVAQAAANVASLAMIPVQTVQIASQIAHTMALRANTAAQLTTTATENTSRIAKIAGAAATIAATIATKAAAAGQWLLNAAMSANPIGLVIAAVALLVGGFILLYKKSETVRSIIDGLWNNVLKPLGEFVGGVLVAYLKTLAKMWLTMARFGLKAFTWLLKAAFKTFDGILSAAERGLGWVPGMGDKIKAARVAFDKFGNATIVKLDKLGDKLKETQDKIDGVARDRSATITVTTTMRRGGALDVGADEVAGQRATGGPVTAGRTYLVGEHRPELFVPKTSGMILPSVPDLSSLADIDVTVGPMGRRGQTIVRFEVDGQVLAEGVLEEADEMAGRL